MAYVILEKIKATAHIESIVAEADLVNGTFVELGELQADGEAYAVTKSGDTTKQLVFHASTPLTYRDDETEADFVLKAGKVGRAYVLEQGNYIAVSADLMNGNAEKGDIVVPNSTGVGFATADSATGLHGVVADVYTDAIVGKMFAIRIA